MSFEHEWPLTVWPTRGEVEQAIAATCGAAKLDEPDVFHEASDQISAHPPLGFPAASEAEQLAKETIVTLLFRVPVAGAIDTALRLDPLGTRETYEKTLEPPVKPDDHYTLAIDLVAPDEDHSRPACVRIYSNEYDNRQAYGILAAIATDLHERLEKLSAFS
jgi:hypothetical protein